MNWLKSNGNWFFPTLAVLSALAVFYAKVDAASIRSEENRKQIAEIRSEYQQIVRDYDKAITRMQGAFDAQHDQLVTLNNRVESLNNKLTELMRGNSRTSFAPRANLNP